MESLIAEPGPRNPLLFLSLSLVNRIPGYNPDEKEALNQLECLNDLISSVSVSIFLLESVKNPVAVAVDSLMSIAVIEAKKSVSVRVSALECLKLLIEKLVACGLNSLIEIIPGILSKMVKISTGRVDVEIDRIIQLSLNIIELIISCFLKEQDQWTKNSAADFVLLKQKYRDNIDMIVYSLRPIIKNHQVSERFHQTLLNILNQNLFNNSLSNSSIKLYLILTSYDNLNLKDTLINNKKVIDIYNNEIVEWFDDNSEGLREIHEEILIEKVKIILGLINLKNSETFLIISDLFKILKQLTELKVSIGGDTVSIEYSDETTEIQSTLKQTTKTENIVNIPKIHFKRKLKLSNDFVVLIEKLFEKMIEIDSKMVENLLLNFEDDTIEQLIQKLDLSSIYYKIGSKGGLMIAGSTVRELIVAGSTAGSIASSPSVSASPALLRDCLKYFERSIKSFDEKSQLIHLATLKLLFSTSEKFPQIIRSNLLIILSAMTSGWIILRETSTQILKVIAKGRCNEFIKENEIFLLDRLGIQLYLPAFYPESPQIISCLVRDILKPETAMKFTDLLVKKVSDNLAVYQGYPAYCKDLLTVAKETIEVISKGEAIEFIDPKDFAFRTEEAANDVNNNDNSNGNGSISFVCQQRIIIDLLKVVINFILSDSKLIRSKSIDLITCSINNFLKFRNYETEPSDLCQLIHLAWPNMMTVLKDSIFKDFRNLDQLDVLIVESFSASCSILLEKFPLFMRDRFTKDFWRLTLNKLGEMSKETSSSFKVKKLLFDTLKIGILNCKPSTEICLEILNYLIESKSKGFDVYESIWRIEPDLIWYFYSIELGELDEIISPSFPDLKSFKIPRKITENENIKLLKSKLKQFII